MEKNNQNKTTKLRIILDSQGPTMTEKSFEICIDNIEIPSEYKIKGVSIVEPLIDGNTGTFRFPALNWEDFETIKKKINQIMDASIVNKEQKQAIYNLICESIYSHIRYLEKQIEDLEKTVIDNPTSSNIYECKLYNRSFK